MSRQSPLLPRKLPIVYQLPPLPRRPPLGPREQRAEEPQTDATNVKLVIAPMLHEPSVALPIATVVAEAKQESHVQAMEEVSEQIVEQVGSHSMYMS